MKIYCTRLEKQHLIVALSTMRRCFIDKPCPPAVTCRDCIELNIEWVLTDEKEDNKNEGS